MEVRGCCHLPERRTAELRLERVSFCTFCFSLPGMLLMGDMAAFADGTSLILPSEHFDWTMHTDVAIVTDT